MGLLGTRARMWPCRVPGHSWEGPKGWPCPVSRGLGHLHPGWAWTDSRACLLPQPCTAFSRKENVHRHALRLLIHLHPRVAPSKLEALQKALEPTGQVGARGGCV